MSLTTLGPLGFVLGLAALAGILFALQRLLVRHREVVVVTTLFWREALEEQRARTLVERFRQPLTYALLLAVAGLLWLGVARPDAVRATGERHVLLLDASAVAARDGRFALAVEALDEALASAPRDRTEVVLCGASPRTLLAPGEDRALLAARLEGAAPEAVPSTLELAMGAALAENRGQALRFTAFGDGYVSGGGVELPDGVTFERASLPPLQGDGSRGIVALGVAPAASGAWDRVDLHIEVTGAEDATAPEVRWANGDAVDGLVKLAAVPGQGVRYALRDVVADGRVLDVRLATGDALAADDSATVTLPDRPRIRVYVAPGPGTEGMDALLAMDPAVEVVRSSADADVLIGEGPAGLPSLRVVPASAQEEAILVTFEGEASGADAALTRAVGELGLDRIDAGALADAIGKPIAVGALPGATRRVSVWGELLQGDAGFARSRSYPVLVGRAVRWLAGTDPIVPYGARGRALPSRVGSAAEDVQLAGPGAPLLDRRATSGMDSSGRPSATFDLSAPDGAPDAGPWRAYTWFLVLALLLLGAEWVLYSRGRIA